VSHDEQRQIDQMMESLRAINEKLDIILVQTAENRVEIKWIKGSGGAILTFISSLIAVVATSLLRYLIK